MNRTIDVSTLPVGTHDSRSLIWWGNLGMMAIEGTMFALIGATYFYMRASNLDWPPGTVLPSDLTLPAINLAILLLSLGAAILADRGAQRKNVARVRAGLALCVVAGLAFLVIRSVAMAHIGFTWSDHAYGSVIWTIVGLHTFHMIAATAESALLLVYSLIRPMTTKQFLDVRCTEVYWYFVVLVWVPFFFIVWT